MQRLLVQGRRDQGGNLATQAACAAQTSIAQPPARPLRNLAIGLRPRQPRQVQQRDSTFRTDQASPGSSITTTGWAMA
jgi:hypothetical protein